ncbi:GTA-gp10 family protein [Stappia sp.]|uniref:GTA-gp10 family protein n=1 Tax=Stappia sp. TaxID=1870903 RepID=UPI003D09C088
MANRRRGEIDATIEGRRHVLVLTLGALAELEEAFAAEDLVALTERFSGGRLSARDITRILGAGLRGGGAEFSDGEVARARFGGGVPEMARLAADLLRATFLDAGTKDSNEQGGPSDADA